MWTWLSSEWRIFYGSSSDHQTKYISWKSSSFPSSSLPSTSCHKKSGKFFTLATLSQLVCVLHLLPFCARLRQCWRTGREHLQERRRRRVDKSYVDGLHCSMIIIIINVSLAADNKNWCWSVFADHQISCHILLSNYLLITAHHSCLSQDCSCRTSPLPWPALAWLPSHHDSTVKHQSQSWCH